MASNLLVGTWDLVTDGDSTAKSEMMLAPPGPESVIGEDTRKLVPADAIKSGGKYRAVVKLQMRYEKQTDSDNRWAMGTGWLIQPDVLVTAGHCVYDWASGMGRAIRINAYIGYNGRDSVTDATSDVQFRKGLRVSTTAGWLASKWNRTSDVSFVKIASPFTDVTYQLIQYLPTPASGHEILGIVGYPGDKDLTDKSGKDEKGAQMYEAWQDTTWDLGTSEDNMLSYTISTSGGQSGSAVLRQANTYTSIGAHTYGGATYNSASPIAGRYGNIYDAYIGVVNDSNPTVKTTKNNIKYVSVSALPQEEGFLDVLADVAKVGTSIASTVLTTGSPFLGPVAGPLAAVAGAALGYVGTLCEATMGDSTSTESAIDSIDMDSIRQRAILGEAVFQSLDAIGDATRLARIGVTMNDYYTKNATGIFKVGPTILHAMGINVQKGNADHSDDSDKSTIEYSLGTESDLDSASKAFRDALLKDSPMVGENFFAKDLGDILVGGVQAADKVDATSQTGLAYLSSIVAPTNLGVDLQDMDSDLQQMLLRAVLGQAALGAAIAENSYKKKSTDTATPLPEGFFDKVKQVVQVIGPRVLNSLPKVIEDVTPVITALIQDSTKPPGVKAAISKGKRQAIKAQQVSAEPSKVRGSQKATLLAGPAHSRDPMQGMNVWEALAQGARKGGGKSLRGDSEDKKNLDGLVWQEL